MIVYSKTFAEACHAAVQAGRPLTDGQADFCREFGLWETLNRDAELRREAIRANATPAPPAPAPRMPSGVTMEGLSDVLVTHSQKVVAPINTEIAALKDRVLELEAKQAIEREADHVPD